MAMLFDGQKHLMNPLTQSSSTRDTAPSPLKPSDSPTDATNLPDWAHSQYTLDCHGNLSTQHPHVSLPSNAGKLSSNDKIKYHF